MILPSAILALAVSLNAQAAPVAATDLEYPELSVTPRASERLEREAAQESKGAWMNGLPFYVSGASSLVAGIVQLKNYDKAKDRDGVSGLAGIFTGAICLGGSAVLYGLYHPYASGLTDVSAVPKKTPREQLFRERLAEESLEAPAQLIRRLAWISAATQFGVGIFMLVNSEAQTPAIPADLIAIGASLVPLIFPSHWAQVASDQREYKKRIYAPVASAAAYIEPGTGRLVPGLNLSFAF